MADFVTLRPDEIDSPGTVTLRPEDLDQSAAPLPTGLPTPAQVVAGSERDAQTVVDRVTGFLGELWNRTQRVSERGSENLGQFLTGTLRAGAMGGEQLPPLPPSKTEQLSREVQQGASQARNAGPLLPVSELTPNTGAARGVAKFAESLTTPENLAIVSGVGALGRAAAATTAPVARAGLRALNTTLGGYFAATMGKGAAANVKEAYDAYKKGDYDTVAEKLGQGTLEALAVVAGGAHSAREGYRIGKETRTGFERGYERGQQRRTTEETLREENLQKAQGQTVTLRPEEIEAVTPEPARELARQPEELRPTFETQATPSETKTAVAETTPVKAVPPIIEPESPSKPTGPRGVSTAGRETNVRVPGEEASYPGRYALRELEDVYPSHNAQNFEPSLSYEHRNDRDYSKASNAERVIRQAQEFEPQFLLNDNPDAVNGPPIIDARGNVLGGNSRTMTLQRVYGQRPEAAQSYRQQLQEKAAQFGFNPEQVAQMKAPVLVRETAVPDAQKAITDFNKTGTAALTSAERAVADSRRLSPKTLDYLAERVAAEGEEGTLIKALSGKAGPQMINRLVEDGVITAQEKPQYIDERGVVTPEGKQRITRLMTGRFFESPAEFEAAAPELRNKLERVVAPLAQVQGRADWDLSPKVREAIGILTEARQRGIKNLNDLAGQQSMFGDSGRDAEALAIAKKLQESPTKAAAAFKQYAQDAALSREGAPATFFEPPTRYEAFEAAFKEPDLAARDLNAEPLDLSRSYTRDGVFSRMDWEVLPARGNQRPPRIRLNWQGTELIGQAIGMPIKGLAVVNPLRMAARVGLYADRVFDAGKIGLEAFHRAIRFTKELSELGRKAPGSRVILYRSDNSLPIRERASLLIEELTHVRQLEVGNNSIRGLIEPQMMASHRTWPLVRRALLKGGYPDDMDILVSEAGAKLAAGTFKELGVTKRLGIDLLEHYYSQLLRKHGPETASYILGFIDRIAKRRLDDLRRKSEVFGRRRDTESRFSSGEDTLSSSVREVPGGWTPGVRGTLPEPSDRELPLQKSGTPKGDAELFSRTGKVDRGNPEAGYVDFTDVANFLKNKLGPEDVPKANYSGLGAQKTRFVRNLSQLKEVNEPATMAAIRTASSRAQASVVLRTAAPKIEAALAGETSFLDFRRALIQSRLEGTRERWLNFADQARRQTDVGLQKAFENGMSDLLEAIEGKNGLPQDLAQTAAALLEPGANPLFNKSAGPDYQTLRELLVRTFTDAASQVTELMPKAEFDKITSGPGFKKALSIYKQLVEKPMAENHALNEGVFSDSLGPLKTYYPLVPVTKADQIRLSGSNYGYKKPRNIANQFATGLADEYDPGMEAFKERLTKAVRLNNRAALLETLQNEGLMHVLKPGELAKDWVVYKGQQYESSRVEVGPPRTTIKDGKRFNVPSQQAVLPKWLARELEPILNYKERPTPGTIRKVIDAMNKFSLAGPLDAVYHTSNLFGTLVANTPFLGKSLAGKAASVPVVKRFAAIAKVIATDPMTEAAAKDLQEMANLGVLPEKFGSQTYSRQYAESTGAELKRGAFGPLLYGPKGVDVRARLVMYRLAREINPDASGPQIHMFVNQLGNYTEALQGEIERSLKRSGFAPFYTAGSTMLRNGINAWLGTGPMPKKGVALRIAQQLSGGAAATVAVWALVYRAYTGKWPWNDKRAKLMQIPVNSDDRRSAIGKALWGKDTSKVGYLNFNFFNPLIGRGARGLGIQGAVDTAAAGGNLGQIIEAGQKDAMNAFAHPGLGPIPKAAFVGLTGSEAYLTSLRDYSGNLAPQFFPAVKKSKPGLSSVGARVAAAAGELNGFYQNLGVATGMVPDHESDNGSKWLRMVTDLAAPGLVGRASNPNARARLLRQQRKERRR